VVPRSLVRPNIELTRHGSKLTELLQIAVPKNIGAAVVDEKFKCKNIQTDVATGAM
jgi:hypothetical protein